MDIAEIYRRGFELYKTNYAISVPFIIVNFLSFFFSLILLGGMTGAGAAPLQTGVSGMGMLAGGAVAIVIISLVLNVLAQGMAIGMCIEALDRGTASLARGWEVLVARASNLIIASILVGLAVGIGLLFFVLPGLVIAFFLWFTIIALIMEELDALTAIKRSYNVVRSNLSSALVYVILAIAIGMGASIVGALLGVIPLIGALFSPVLQGLASGLVTMAGVIFFTRATKTERGEY